MKDLPKVLISLRREIGLPGRRRAPQNVIVREAVDESGAIVDVLSCGHHVPAGPFDAGGFPLRTRKACKACQA